MPRNKSAVAIAKVIRNSFFNGHREAEFMCVCDINKESKEVIQELNDAQVSCQFGDAETSLRMYLCNSVLLAGNSGPHQCNM